MAGRGWRLNVAKERPEPGQRLESVMVTALDGTKVVDVSGIGAFASMILADFGAEVVRIRPTPGARATSADSASTDRRQPDGNEARLSGALRRTATHRGSRSIALNLKHEDGQAIARALVAEADVFLESFRPGVCDRLGLGYEELSALNPRLVYASLTGYGQTGPYRDRPGHDLNYIAVGGALGLFAGPDGRSTIPLNIIADFAGGGLYTCLAICLALLARDRTGRGQHIDMAMSDGVLSLLTTVLHDPIANDTIVEDRTNLLNGGVPYYDTYRCADQRWIAVACLEPHFFANLCRGMDLEQFLDAQFEEARHAELRAALVARFASRPRDEWVDALEPHDVCVSPVLAPAEVAEHEHNTARGTVGWRETSDGPELRIGVGPKLSETPGSPGKTAADDGDSEAILLGLGYETARIDRLREAGTVG